MSDLFKKIKSWFDKIKVREYSYEKGGLNPAKDWTVSLISAISVVILFAIFSVYLYLQIDANQIFNVTSNADNNEAKINMTLLDKTVSDINQREQVTSDIKQNKNIPTDPSI